MPADTLIGWFAGSQEIQRFFFFSFYFFLGILVLVITNRDDAFFFEREERFNNRQRVVGKRTHVDPPRGAGNGEKEKSREIVHERIPKGTIFEERETHRVKGEAFAIVVAVEFGLRGGKIPVSSGFNINALLAQIFSDGEYAALSRDNHPDAVSFELPVPDGLCEMRRI